jgi:uncharacterized protein (DUF362 family)/NAD-dependent dihydropyrimidine dehydrogenase PreA subunit
VQGTVAAARAETYDPDVVAAAVRRVLEPFGGARGIGAGKKNVLLKPNVLRPAFPEEAVTTHPEVIRAVAREFLELGCAVSVGDGPGGDPGPALPAFEKSGIAQVCAELGIPLLNFQKEGSVAVELRSCPARSINVAKPVVDAEVIVSIAKVKTHNLTHMTCALKNPYGYIPGFLKGRLHALAPRVWEFSQIVCALWEVFPPAITVVDGITAMQGQGPSGGEPYHAGWILAGTDPLAIDTLLAWAMGFDPRAVPLLAEARRRGLGTGDLDRIRILNATRDDLRFENFALPTPSTLLRRMPRWLTSILGLVAGRLFWVRPHVVPERCEICHRCVRSCPTGAMRAEVGAPPRLAVPADCISCLCCQEMCPAKAIETRKSFFVTKCIR